jgi:hypothetical protein
VTAAQKPVVKLTRDQGEDGVCSEGQDFSTFEYTATSSTEGDITVKLTGSAPCKLQGGVTEGIGRLLRLAGQEALAVLWFASGVIRVEVCVGVVASVLLCVRNCPYAQLRLSQQGITVPA